MVVTKQWTHDLENLWWNAYASSSKNFFLINTYIDFHKNKKLNTKYIDQCPAWYNLDQIGRTCILKDNNTYYNSKTKTKNWCNQACKKCLKK